MATAYVAEEGRKGRGLQIFEDQGDRIQQLGRGLYRVPSATNEDQAYHIDARRQFCSCWDYYRINMDRDETTPINACKHIVAVGIFRRRTAICDGCRTRKMRTELREVLDSLTYFEGDLLCARCTNDSDAEVM